MYLVLTPQWTDFGNRTCNR